MTAKEYFDFKCDYLEKKYGALSLPLIQNVFYEAERKFGTFEKPERAKTLDDILEEKSFPTCFPDVSPMDNLTIEYDTQPLQTNYEEIEINF